MKNSLFKFEFRKLLRSSYTYVCLGVILSFLTLELIFITILNEYIFDTLYEEYEIIYTSNAYAGCYLTQTPFLTIIMIFVCTYFLKDYKDGTLKNIYGRGVTRNQYFFTRLVVALTTAVAYFIIFYIVEYILSSAFIGCWNLYDFKTFAISIGLNLVCVIAYTLFACFICTFIKKTGLAIVLCILIPTFAQIVISILDASLYYNEITEEYYSCDKFWFDWYSESIGYIYPLDTDFDFTKNLSDYVPLTYEKFCIDLLIVNFTYSAGFVGFGWLISRDDKI